MPHTARPAPASARSTVRRVLAGAVSLLLALLGVAAVPATASAAELDAITGVEITRPTGEIHQGDSIRLDATWAVPDDARPGDTFRLALPTTPRVVGTTDSFDLTDPTGAVVGTCAVDETQVLCTLGEYAATHTEVAGTLFFWAKVTETSTSEVLVFRTGGDVEIRVDVPGGIREGKPWGWGAPTSPVKNGWFDTKDGRAHWQVNVPGQYLTGPDGEPVVVTDTFDPRLTLVTESIRMVAVPVTRWNGGNFWNEWFWLSRSQYVVETGPAANQFRFSVPDALGADHVYVLVYATEVPADARDGDRYGNSVTGLGTSTVTAAVRFAGGAGTGAGEALRSIRLAKQVDGDDAQRATGPFAFALDCRGTDGATLDGFPRAATVLAGGTTTFADVPVGAVCGLTETDAGGADRVAFAPAGPVVVTTSSPSVIDVVATNTFDARVGGVPVTEPATGSRPVRDGLVPAGTATHVEPTDGAVGPVTRVDAPAPPGVPSPGTSDGVLAVSGATVQAASVGAVVLLLAGILAVVARRRSRG